MPTSIFDEYRNRLERRRRHHKTLRGFETAATRFLEWCAEEGIRPEDPDPTEVERYFDELPLAAGTKKNHLVQLRAAYRYAQRRGVLSRDPTVEVELPRVPDFTPRVIPVSYLRTARDAITDEQQYLLFHVAAYTGCRQHEVLKMRHEDITLRDRTIEVIGKGGKRRLVPIHPALGELLPHNSAGFLFPGRGGNMAAPSTLLLRLQRILPEYGFHDFRRTVASSLDANGVEEGLIYKIMGWSRNTVFDRHYRNVAPERLQQAIMSLYADDPL